MFDRSVLRMELVATPRRLRVFRTRKIILTRSVLRFYVRVMFSFLPFLTLLQTAIAVASKRDLTMPGFFTALWNRVGRMGRRLERLIEQWRAGTLPKARERGSEKGKRADRVRKPKLNFPTGYGWLVARVPDIHQRIGSLELLLGQAECARFLTEVPQARKIVGLLEKMLLVPIGKTAAKFKREVVWPPPGWLGAAKQAQMVVGPTGRLEWI